MQEQRTARAPHSPYIRPYIRILRNDGAVRFSAASFVGRLPMSMVGLGTVLLITAYSGRYGLAGIISGAGSIGYAAVAPQLGKLADRLGQHRVLRPMAAAYALSTLAFLVCARLSAPVWVLLVTGTLAGSFLPPLGSMVRARWSTLLSDPGDLHAAFSLESVADELIFVIGPVAVTVLATEVYPAAGLGAAMILGLTGTWLLASQRASEPRLASRARRDPAAPGGGVTGRFSLASPSLITLIPVYLCIGSMFASVDLSTVAFAQQHGHKPLAGVLLGTGALGSAIGGLWYGTRAWRAPLERRFLITMGLAATGAATFWAQPGLVPFAATFFCCAMAIAPTLIAGYSLVQQQARPGRETEGMTWLSSAIGVGVACGSAVSGYLIDVRGPHWSYAFAGASGVAATLITAAGFGRLRTPAPAASPPPG
jgi:MFS family permease